MTDGRRPEDLSDQSRVGESWTIEIRRISEYDMNVSVPQPDPTLRIKVCLKTLRGRDRYMEVFRSMESSGFEIKTKETGNSSEFVNNPGRKYVV